jgi:transposase
MRVCVGMDVHRKRSQVAVVDDTGIQQRNRNVPNHPTKLVPVLGGLPPGTPVAFEAATAGAGWSGCRRSWSRTWSIPAAARPSPRPGCRNDKVDARTLAQLLRADLLPEAWIAPQQVRDLRALLRHRAALVQLSTSCKHRIHAVLADRGIGQDRGRWTGPGRAWLAGLELPPIPRAIIGDCCGLLDALATPIARLEREIHGLAKPDPRVQTLMILPGIAKLTAMTLVAEIGDIGRFPTARKLCAWAGLTPQVRNADRKVRHGHITKQGSPWVRGSLQEAAQTAKRHPMFASAYAQLARRRGTNIATTAIARRLLARSFHLLIQLEPSRTHWRRPVPDALGFAHEPATRPPVLTEQPGSGLTVMRTPHPGPEGVHASHLRTAVRAFSS